MLAAVHVGAARKDAPGQFNRHPEVTLTPAKQKPSFKSRHATRSLAMSAEMELGAGGVIGLGAPRHVAVVLRSGQGVSLRMQTIVGHRLKVTPLKLCNVLRNLAQRQLIASSMSGVTGARARVLALERSSDHGPLAFRAERMVSFATIVSGRFRLVILPKMKSHLQVASRTQTQLIASLMIGQIGQGAPPLVDRDSKPTQG